MKNENLKIEFTTFPIIGELDHRHILWRVEPSQLTFWQRLFNPWHLLRYVTRDGSWMDWYEPYEYKEIKKKYETLHDMEVRKEALRQIRAERRKSLKDEWENEE